jgi:hypothetical protein
VRAFPGRSGSRTKGARPSDVTRAGITRIIRKELIPTWERRVPNSIQRPEIQHWAKAIADGKGRKKAAPYLANRSLDYMAMIYPWAVRREILRYTPFLGLETPVRHVGFAARSAEEQRRPVQDEGEGGGAVRTPRHADDELLAVRGDVVVRTRCGVRARLEQRLRRPGLE